MEGRMKQGGMTLTSFVIVLIVAGFFAFLIMRLFPVYSEYYAVSQNMRSIAQEPGVATWPPEKVKESLFKRFYISYVENVKAEHVKLTRNNGYNLTVKYEVRKPLLYNLDFVAKFEKTVELTRTDSVD